MASTDDCKNLLATDPQTSACKGSWKRLVKRSAPDGVERIFASSDGSTFARLVEANNMLSVTAVGATREAVDQIAVGTVGVKAGAASIAPPVPHAIEADPLLIARAQNLIADFMLYDKDPSCVEIGACGVAFANQCVFGLGYSEDDETTMVTVMPRAYWDQNKHCMDQELPLRNILPGDEQETPNGSSEWIIYGFDTATDIANAMLEKGFVWDANVQKFLDRMIEDDVPEELSDAIKHTKGLYAGKTAAVKPKPGKPKGGTAFSEFTVLSTAVELDALGKQVLTNKERDTKSAWSLKNSADLQVTVVRMPPESDPLYAAFVQGISANYRKMHAFGTTVVGIAHNSGASTEMDRLIGSGQVGDVAGFLGFGHHITVAADYGKLVRGEDPQMARRMIDVPGLIEQIMQGSVTPKKMGP